MKRNKNKQKKVLLGGFLALALSTGIGCFILSRNIYFVSMHGPAHSAAEQEPSDTTPSAVTLRLQQRIVADGRAAPALVDLEQAVQERSRALNRSMTMHVFDSSRPDVPAAEWTLSFADHPELLTMHSILGAAVFTFNTELLKVYIREDMFEGLQSRRSIVIRDTVDDGKIVRAADVPVATSGFDYDVGAVADAVQNALRTGSDVAMVDLTYGTGSVRVELDGHTREFSLLASGLSNYTGSPEERVWNVHKAINERVNNIIVRPGQEFSFVDALDTPVTVQKGWKEGLGLFGGGAAMTPGAGICQAATTVYRAALLAGLPITYKRNHSMFVDHYEPYGIGLDATVFPGFHDMTFLNDTADIILIQAFIDEETQDVTVNFYGIPDGRTVALDGPYFNNTPHRNALLRPLDWDEIGWVQTITDADGTAVQKPIISTYYKGFSHKIKQKYAGTPGIVLLHIAEPADTLASATP